MSHLQDHAPCFRRIGQLNGMPDAAKAHSFHRLSLCLVEADWASDESDSQLFGHRALLRRLFRHRYAPTSSASSLPRYRATSDGSLRSMSPWNVARTTLCGLADPSDFVSTFWMPHDSTTARTAPPA